MEEQQQQEQPVISQSQQFPSQRTPTPPSSSSPQLPPRPTKPTSPSSSSSTTGVPLSSFWSSRPTHPPPTTSSTATHDIASTPSPAIPTSTKPATPPRPAVASKPAYLNTSYVPKKVNIAVQNDTCTKCGKAVYAAELVSHIRMSTWREIGIHWCIGTWSWQQVSQALFEMHRMWQVVELNQYGGQGL